MLSRFFIDRPIFAWVISIVMTFAGIVCVVTLPIAQYPPIVPPTVIITANYPGASAATLASTVGQPIEEQVNGVEGMIYMSSTCTNNGQYTLTVSFEVGFDQHTALLLTQIQSQLAMPQLPQPVQAQGLNVRLKAPNILLAVNLYSPDGTQDTLTMSNYAQIYLYDELSRIKGISMVTFLGQREYSMRVWVDPTKLAGMNMTVGQVINAIKEQNLEVAAGNVGQQPVPLGQNYQLVLNALGRLTDPEQFGDIVIKTGEAGRIVHLRDVVRDAQKDAKNKTVPGTEGISLGSQNSDVDCWLSEMKDGQRMRYPSVGLAVYALPSANSLTVAGLIDKKMKELSKKFPHGMEYRFAYDTTPFIRHSVEDVINTIIIAAVLVIVVVLVFIQDWHAMLLPMMDIVVSIIGTFVVMKILGFSLNNLSLFGLVLAVGIVVDDSIVVVENIERWMGMGLPSREATIKAMEEITPSVIGISLVLTSVFIPCAFIPGLTGQFFKQFALTIAASALISATNALTLAPARAAAWIKPHGPGHESHAKEALPRIAYVGLLGWATAVLLAPLVPEQWKTIPHISPEMAPWVIALVLAIPGAIAGWFLARPINQVLNLFFGLFNKAFDMATSAYTWIVGMSLRLTVVVLLIYVGLLALTGIGFTTSPTGFIPEQDQGYLLGTIALPDAASVQRTGNALKKLEEIALHTKGVKQIMSVGGFSAFFQCDASNWATMFIILDSFEERTTPETQGAAIIRKLNIAYHTEVQDCNAVVFGAPPVPGLGQGGGFQLQIEDRGGLGLAALQEVTDTIVEKARKQPGLVQVFTSFRADTPQLYLDIDREKAKQMDVTFEDVNQTLTANMGSLYINQFNTFGRIWQVNIQAQGDFRRDIDGLKLLYVRNQKGENVPLASLLRVRNDSGPVFVMRYNDNNSAAINGNTLPSFSSGQAISVMEKLCDETMPDGMAMEWTNISYQEVNAGNEGIFIFALAVALVFLVLAAMYESWGLPVAILLVVPMCLLSSITGLVWIAHKPMDIFCQIGFVVLIAMAAKNAILIVAYAKDKRLEGMPRREATLEGSKLRLRPILMTSLAFILGVYPLVVATGAGWEMRRSLGTAVFSGMLGVTFFGIFLTPVFYYAVTWLADPDKPAPPPSTAGTSPNGEKAETKATTQAIMKPS